ncbi:Uncharacterized protein dnm_066410 [Desulfonema magnum]|uniref:Uncharacterized protein n=1 Tax=Desulfonema magnum TaxID=45655 RepID=A0A975GR06_9BACT|nr:Uncharacterized protein dnm_066410 [Desulfonema magnum]
MQRLSCQAGSVKICYKYVALTGLGRPSPKSVIIRKKTKRIFC